MRTYLLPIPVGLFLLAQAVSAQIQLVNVASCSSAPEPGSECTIPATGQGNLIVVGWQIGGHANTANGIQTVTDNVGNAYVQVPGAQSMDSIGGYVADLWYAKNSVAGATTLTITPSIPVYHAAAVIWEFSGADPNTPLDQAASLSDQPATLLPLGASVTTTSTVEAVVSLLPDSGIVSSITLGNLFTNDFLLKTNGWAHVITSSSGTYAAQWIGTLGTYASSTASFQAAIAAAPTVSLSWNPSTSPNLSGYNIYRGSVSGGPYTAVNTSLVPGSTYTDSGVQGGLTYYYVATAVDYTGAESVYSNEATAVVPPGQ